MRAALVLWGVGLGVASAFWTVPQRGRRASTWLQEKLGEDDDSPLSADETWKAALDGLTSALMEAPAKYGPRIENDEVPFGKWARPDVVKGDAERWAHLELSNKKAVDKEARALYKEGKTEELSSLFQALVAELGEEHASTGTALPCYTMQMALQTNMQQKDYMDAWAAGLALAQSRCKLDDGNMKALETLSENCIKAIDTEDLFRALLRSKGKDWVLNSETAYNLLFYLISKRRFRQVRDLFELAAGQGSGYAWARRVARIGDPRTVALVARNYATDRNSDPTKAFRLFEALLDLEQKGRPEAFGEGLGEADKEEGEEEGEEEEEEEQRKFLDGLGGRSDAGMHAEEELPEGLVAHDYEAVADALSDLLLCNALLAACGRSGNIGLSRRVKAAMDALGVQADAYSYSSLIHGADKAGQPALALEFLQEMQEDAGLQPDGIVYASVIQCAVSIRQMALAERLLHEYREALIDADTKTNTSPYDSLLVGFAQDNEWEKVDEILGYMQTDDVPVRDSTWCQIVEHAARFGDFKRALEVIKVRSQLGSTVIPAHVRARIEKERGRTFSDSPEAKLRDLYDAFLRGLAASGRSKEAEAAFSQYQKLFGKGALNEKVYTSLVKAYAMDGDLAGATDVLKRMSADNIPPNSYTLQALVRGCGVSKKVDAIPQILKLFEQYGVKATEVIYATMLHAYIETEEWNKAIKTLTDMLDSGFRPQGKLCTRLVSHLYEAGGAEDALWVLRKGLKEKWWSAGVPPLQMRAHSDSEPSLTDEYVAPAPFPKPLAFCGCALS
eukprot:scaffold1642_cov252-Pinguiococcus_pyrenoidosus.AAC.32